MRGFGSVVIADAIAIDVTVMEGKNGLFVTFPSRPDPKTESGYRDTVRCISRESRQLIQDAVLRALEVVSNQTNPANVNPAGLPSDPPF